jgi:acyl-CoA hydrolase
VNDTATIRQNQDVVSINSCIEVDLTGQVVADSIGPKVFSGVGGQIDFVRGASLSPGGKAILAFRATAGKDQSISRIVPTLSMNAGVVTTRAHMHYACTGTIVCACVRVCV